MISVVAEKTRSVFRIEQERLATLETSIHFVAKACVVYF